ncbi:malonate--CoA ligase ACSF3, mitochondrial-like isoform X2 [Anthonomus grandis grandis]|uniref:malonate--CoA ligase ACSF3, mitochondrial-like isoform X2 n=1 Tax=Anthonomus grandis grandis TaxID=2921223 RepID=UPI002165DC68|nr:malonate--CoA ligase ACSF3, mitochondrial-like isoform X2 [Anthonomus grandis grandis]
MSRFLRIPFVLNHLSRRFQQTQAKLATKIKIKQPYQHLGCLAGGPVFRNAKLFPDRVAVRDKIAAYTYGNVFMSAYQLSKEITNLLDCKSHEKVLFLCPNDVQYVITLWAIWMSGQLAVPVSPLHPKGLLLYYTNDCSAKLIITVPEFSDLMRIISKNCGTRLHVLDDKLKLNCTLMQASQPSDLEGGRDDIFYNKSDAMILYTSGTTANPKGVVLSYKNLSTQASALLDAWKWSSDDVILHTLPLHHIHGIVNALLCPLYAGAKIMMLNRFHANTVWSYLLGVNARPDDRRITVFMGVPTMYSKLIQEYERVFKKDPKMAEYIKNTLKTKVRLTVTGSAPLSEPLFKEWEEITGHRLLERYGMTETGMTLSNVYDSDRAPGFVGVPLPGVSTKIIEVKDGPNFGKTLVECTNVDGTVVYQKNGQKMADGQNPTGELFVKGEGVFMRYHQRPDTTKEVFTQDGWFKTGDISQFSVEKKVFKILGSAAIITKKRGELRSSRGTLRGRRRGDKKNRKSKIKKFPI